MIVAELVLGRGDLYRSKSVRDEGGKDAFVKIQSQDGDGQFEYAAFYIGNNGEGVFFALKQPASSPATPDP